MNFLSFIDKNLQLNFDYDNQIFPILNTNQIKIFIGKIVNKIIKSIFNVIRTQASRLNIYTDELRGDSKAIKVFYGDRLDFIDETIKKKEILLFLMNPTSTGSHMDLLRSFESLDLDPGMAPEYVKALLNDAHLSFVGDEIDELYSEVENVKERLEMVSIIDNEHVSYNEDEDM